ncbi:hypothetical protein E4S40_06495 [Algoriphagus kandeliae]|uniref:Lipoprotein n=1 Tax=Algoriphagus kandeliae TaxID=2562278 RepID=A0A4Y9QVN2_9BACT|nr:hypothetical protein [Algoriphagus kandeliae]TFV95868.1 hypothetical protein E4S40_06495 [Algoriphagus kandeliae]
MKTFNSLIFLLLTGLLGCSIHEDNHNELSNKVKLLSERYGFRAESVNDFKNPENETIQLTIKEFEYFLKYRKQTHSNIEKSKIDFSEIMKILERNNISIPQQTLESFRKNSSTTPNNKILCLHNAHTVSARVPAMVLPGQDLNGVKITLAVGNGNLNSHSFSMYGIYPFMGVRGTTVNPVNPDSWPLTNTYVFQVEYTVTFNLWIDGAPFTNYETYYIRMRIDGCTGSVSWFYAQP